MIQAEAALALITLASNQTMGAAESLHQFSPVPFLHSMHESSSRGGRWGAQLAA